MTTLQDALDALKAADAAGNEEDARKLAQIVQTLSTRKKSFGAKDILPSIGRGVTSTFGLIGDVQRGILSKVGVPESVQQYITPTPTSGLRGGVDKAVDLLGGKEGESVFSGGEGTLGGRAFEFAGSSLAFGAPGLGRTLINEGGSR